MTLRRFIIDGERIKGYVQCKINQNGNSVVKQLRNFLMSSLGVKSSEHEIHHSAKFKGFKLKS